MKKKSVAISSLTLLMSALFMSSASAADGTVYITGTITDTTCTINSGTADIDVALPTVSSNSLAEAGDTAGATPFTIALTECSGTTLGTASTYFEPGTYVDTDTGRLNLDTSSTASNVQVQLLNSDYEAIVAGADSDSQNDVSVDISSGEGDLQYYARYYATGAASSGDVSTQVDYTISYE